MNAFSTDPEQLTYRDLPPVLIAGSNAAALARAQRTIEDFGLRIAAAVSIEAAAGRFESQAAASAIWIELDEESAGPSDELIDQLNRDVREGRYSAVVSAPAQLIDLLSASLPLDGVELLIDADDAERASALALAIALRGDPLRVHDVASDKNAARLRQLSDEVNRIAATLARLSTGPTASPRPVEAEIGNEAPDVAVETVRAIIRARRLRARYFSEELFADPAWDMLLDLFQAEISKLRVPVSSLCIAAAVPATTALRWLKTMVQQGIFVRRADPHDGRRVFVELAPQSSNALKRYFAEVAKVAVI
jgi:DNA-binding MarR family transcriptional regulator